MYFYGSRESGPQGKLLYFRPSGWDADDLFSSCHYDGNNALDDGHGIVYCLEGLLDRALIHSEEVYGAFLDALEVMILQTMPLAVVTDELDGVKQDLFAVLDDTETCAAMKELDVDASDGNGCEGFENAVTERMESFLGKVEARIDDLLEKIAAARAPSP
jgi:hypothetical protein